MRDLFVHLDKSKQGTITFDDLKKAMVETQQQSDEQETVWEIVEACEALDYNGDREIHYTDFLAAMSGSHIDLSNDLLLMSAFRRFDEDKRGRITSDNVRNILGENSHFDQAFQAPGQKNSMNFVDFAADVRGLVNEMEVAKCNTPVAVPDAEKIVPDAEKIVDISSLLAPSSNFAVRLQSHWNALKKSVMMFWMPCLLQGRF